MIAVRPAAPGDVPALVALMRQLSGHEIAPAMIAGLIAPESGQAVLVAEEAGQVLGALAMNQSPMLHRPAPDARITSLVVDEGARGRGVGRSLVDAALDTARRWNCARLELTTRMGREDAHAFYRALGFENSSIRFHRMLD